MSNYYIPTPGQYFLLCYTRTPPNFPTGCTVTWVFCSHRCTRLSPLPCLTPPLTLHTPCPPQGGASCPCSALGQASPSSLVTAGLAQFGERFPANNVMRHRGDARSLPCGAGRVRVSVVMAVGWASQL